MLTLIVKGIKNLGNGDHKCFRWRKFGVNVDINLGRDK